MERLPSRQSGWKTAGRVVLWIVTIYLGLYLLVALSGHEGPVSPFVYVLGWVLVAAGWAIVAMLVVRAVRRRRG